MQGKPHLPNLLQHPTCTILAKHSPTFCRESSKMTTADKAVSAASYTGGIYVVAYLLLFNSRARRHGTFSPIFLHLSSVTFFLSPIPCNAQQNYVLLVLTLTFTLESTGALLETLRRMARWLDIATSLYATYYSLSCCLLCSSSAKLFYFSLY